MLLAIAPLGLLLLPGLTYGDGDHFGYEEGHGPETWGENNPQCNKDRQSPIDIEKRNIKTVCLPPLKLNIRAEYGYFGSLTNNGHSAMVKIDESKSVKISGGPLNSTYTFEQCHFHWGKNNYEGSEHLVNGKSYPMELHCVFRNDKYESMNEATSKSDGLAVIGQMIKANRPTFNPAYKPIVDILPNIVTAGKEERFKERLPLRKLLVPNVQNYFTYAGSLTTPPCSEVVTWIVLENVQHLSSEQVAQFRNLDTPEGGKMTQNFRPVQPLNNREVKRNIPKGRPRIASDRNDYPDSGQRNTKVPLSIVAVGALFALLLLAI